MPIERVLLDWNKPFLPIAADYLVKTFTSTQRLGPNTCDLRQIIVVLPTSRACRRLVEQIDSQARRKFAAVIPPTTSTIGELPEYFYSSQYPNADSTDQRLAWVSALTELRPDQLAQLVREQLDSDSLNDWQLLAEQCQSLWSEISSAGYSFVEIAAASTQLHDSPSQQRWSTLQQAFDLYLEKLQQHQLTDRYFERRLALEQKKISAEFRVVLAAIAEIPLTTRNLIAELSEVTALIHADQSHSDGFGQFGEIKPDYWSKLPARVSDSQLIIAETPSQLAQLLVCSLAKRAETSQLEEIAIGHCSEEILPALLQQFNHIGLNYHLGQGSSMTRTPIYSLISVIAKFVRGQKFSAFCELARHSHFANWLTKQLLPPPPATAVRLASNGQIELPLTNSAAAAEPLFLGLLDRFQSRHLQSQFPAPLSKLKTNLSNVELETLAKAQQLTVELFAPLLSQQKSISSWAVDLVQILETIFADQQQLPISYQPAVSLLESISQSTFARASFAQETFEQDENPLSVDNALAETGKASPEYQALGYQALALFLSLMAKQNLPDTPTTKSIEMLGWLELAHDEAPSLLIAGFNEGAVPQAINSDPYLPNTLRSHLGLVDNEFRFARDNYLLQAMLHSKSDIELFCFRRCANGDPELPSRLLLTDDTAEVARRIINFFDPPNYGNDKEPTALLLNQVSQQSSALVPMPAQMPTNIPENSLSVVSATSFRDYIDCPFIFYLKHVLRLEEINDREHELNPALFGTLAHRVLYLFGQDRDVIELTDPGKIGSILKSILSRTVAEFFGSAPHPAVKVQVEQLLHRFGCFAHWQAQWTAKGWIIQEVESRFKESELSLELANGKTLGIRGAIDRIDFHPQTSSWVVFDYKTSDSAATPESKHYSKTQGWTDFQLPLYRRFALESKRYGDNIFCGYINLSKDEHQIGEKMATWHEDDYHSADKALATVAEQISAGIFWPPNPNSFAKRYYAGIFGDYSAEQVFEDLLVEEAENG